MEPETQAHTASAPPSGAPHETEGTLKTVKEEDLFAWRAPVRPFKKRDRQFFTTVGAIAILVGLIMFFLEGFLPVAVIAAMYFLLYVLSTIPPEEVEHKLTNKALYFAGKKYLWDELMRFWFADRFGTFGTELLVVEAVRPPWRLEIVIHSQDKENLRKILEERLPYEEAAPSFLDKAASWLSRRVQLEG